MSDSYELTDEGKQIVAATYGFLSWDHYAEWVTNNPDEVEIVDRVRNCVLRYTGLGDDEELTLEMKAMLMGASIGTIYALAIQREPDIRQPIEYLSADDIRRLSPSP